MAYDRYDPRRDPREDRSRWHDERFERERMSGRDERHHQGGREERGFFERAGEQIASWFGDDDDDRRPGGDERWRGRDERDRGERGWMASDRGRAWSGGGGRDRDDRDSDRGWFSSDSYRGEGGETGSHGPMWSGGGRSGGGERGYRPMTGDYSRSERGWGGGREPGRGGLGRSDSEFDRDPYRRSSFAGSSDHSSHHDPHYHEWRQRQMSELDRDYEEYRREHQSKFESDFGSWRERRMSKRQMLGQIREHMEVLGNDEQHIGTVDRVAGDRIILTKSDDESGGAHHSLSCTDIDRVEGDRVILECSAEQAKHRWRDENRSRALFEREDQGEAGPHMLDRSFSGTYR